MYFVLKNCLKNDYTRSDNVSDNYFDYKVHGMCIFFK